MDHFGILSKFLILILVSSCSSSIPKYNRSEWGRWSDPDRNCLNTRHEILKSRSLTKPVVKNCKVVSGSWRDFYYSEVLTNPKKIDIDHVVPLKHAHESGGYKWPSNKRKQFYTDQENLVITNRKYNRQKGPKTILEWIPVDQRYACKYVKRWFSIKNKYLLNIEKQEVGYFKSLNCSK